MTLWISSPFLWARPGTLHALGTNEDTGSSEANPMMTAGLPSTQCSQLPRLFDFIELGSQPPHFSLWFEAHSLREKKRERYGQQIGMR